MSEAEADQRALAQAIKLIMYGISREEAEDIFRLQGLNFTTQLDKLVEVVGREWISVQNDNVRGDHHHHLILEEIYNVNFDGSVRYILGGLSVSPYMLFSHRVLASTSGAAYLTDVPEEWPAELLPADTKEDLSAMINSLDGVSLSSITTGLNWQAPTQHLDRTRSYESFGDYISIFANVLLRAVLGDIGDGSFIIDDNDRIVPVPHGSGGMAIDETKRYIASKLTSKLSARLAAVTVRVQPDGENVFVKAIRKLGQLSLYLKGKGYRFSWHCPGAFTKDRLDYPDTLDWRSTYALCECGSKRKLEISSLEGSPVRLSEEEWDHIEALYRGLKAAHRLISTPSNHFSAPIIACDVASKLYSHCEKLKVKTETAGVMGEVAQVALDIWEGIIFNGRTVIPSAIAIMPWGRFAGIKAVFPKQDLNGLERQLGEDLDRIGVLKLPSCRKSPIKDLNKPPHPADKHDILHDFLHSTTYPLHPYPFPHRYYAPGAIFSHRYPAVSWPELNHDGLEYWAFQSDYGVNYQIAKLAISLLSTPVISYEERVRCMGTENESSRAMRERLTKTSLGGKDGSHGMMMQIHEELHRNCKLDQAASALGKRRRVD